MARASIETMLPLDRWAALLGINPLHFNGVYSSVSPSVTCSEPVLQYAWQNSDKTGREEIAQAIADAEEVLSSWLGFLPKPKWAANEPHWLQNGEFWGNPVTKTDMGYLISGGQEAKTLLGNVVVSYADLDSDGYKETATCSIVTTGTTDIDEIALYFPATGGDSAWEIRPITVTYNALLTKFSITFRREQAVVAALQEGFLAGDEGVSGDDDANFLPTVDVYRHYNDPSVQVRFAWTPEASCSNGWLFSSLSCTCGSSSCASCSYLTQYGCMSLRDERTGMLAAQPGAWDTASASFVNSGWTGCSFNPARLNLWYRSGWRNNKSLRPMSTMDPKYERLIAYLSIASLSRPFCNCAISERVMKYWGEDLGDSYSKGDESHAHQQTPKNRDNPLGTTRAAIRAWDTIQRERIGEAVLAR